ncbi:MAG TPA: hypothetical protein VLD65_02820 [Anaerolineales bacterium]|nr:hypothetical protein [Anaerolineales bacterium]
MTDRVICRSDHDYIGYPIAFYWLDQRLEVTELLLQNRTPKGYLFKVHNERFGDFELTYDLHTDQWSVHQL